MGQSKLAHGQPQAGLVRCLEPWKKLTFQEGVYCVHLSGHMQWHAARWRSIICLMVNLLSSHKQWLA